MAMESPFKTMMLEPPQVFTATTQEIQKEEVSLGAKHEWLREHGIDCLDDETTSQRYAIFTKMHLGADALHTLLYYYYQLIPFEKHLAAT